MLSSYQAYWVRAFDFRGRTTRYQYWWSVFAGAIIGMLFWLPHYSLISESIDSANDLQIPLEITIFGWLNYLPTLSINVRRLRDVGKSWQWLFMFLIPIIGPIWFFLKLISPSKGKNES